MTALNDNQNTMEISADINDLGGVEVKPQMSVSGGPYGKFHEPIHESLTLAALITSNSDVAHGTTVKSARNQDWEYIRGAVWNDDPDCQLFNDSEGDNHSYASGGVWVYYYGIGASQWNPNDLDTQRMNNPIGRSHYGDLQFLHCMASNPGEEAEKTKAKVMTWMEVMYKLANKEDGITPATEIGDTKLKQFFPAHSLPKNFMSLDYLLSKNSAFQGLDIRRRALGSMFHVIQDSYAIGHTKRTPLNLGDKISDDPLKFKQGVADRWGEIENFHTYRGQNGDAHSHYDHATDGIPDPNNLGNLDQWNGLIGCRDAVEKCRGLLALKQAGKKWDDVEGVRDYLDQQVFAVSQNATPANTHVL